MVSAFFLFVRDKEGASIKAEDLIGMALQARMLAWAPYSNFLVGAALLSPSGSVYTGCNVENVAYTPTCCAERIAFYKAVSQGEHQFSAIAVVGGSRLLGMETLVYPCGVCRQVMMEFCKPDSFEIIVAIDQLHYQRHLLQELLPHGFGPDSLDVL